MISRYLIEIKELLEKIDKIFSSDTYFASLEKRLATIQEENQRLREENKKLRDIIGGNNE